MRKWFILVLGATGLLAVSCSKEDEITSAYKPVVFHTTMERTYAEGTRVYADENLKILWDADDMATVFNKKSGGLEYKFKGETGDSSGDLIQVGADEPTGSDLQKVYAVLPHNEANAVTAEGFVKAVFPAEQHYRANSFGKGANVMVSKGTDDNLRFKNAGGFLVLKLYGFGVAVKSVSLKANGGEIISGTCDIDMTGDLPTTTMASSGSDEITLVCDSPVDLVATAEWYKEFWFALPPVTLSSGFTVNVEVAESDNTFSKSTTKEVVIERNQILRMSPVNVTISGITPYVTPEAVDLGLASGLKWSNFNLGASTVNKNSTATSARGLYFAWGEVRSKTSFSWANYTRHSEGSATKLTKYNSNSSYGVVDEKASLDLDDDPAHVLLGGKWRLPTSSEFQELMTSCTWSCWSGSDVTGTNDNQIWLPCWGSAPAYPPNEDSPTFYAHYMTSDLAANSQYAKELHFKYSNIYEKPSQMNSSYSQLRYVGVTVRPVWDENLYDEKPY